MRKLLPLLAAAALIGGCGGDDDPVEGGAIGLTEWLPKDAVTYTAVDIAAFKEELELPEDADPMRAPALPQGVQEPFSRLLIEAGKPRESEAVLDAVDPSAVTSAAMSGSSDGTWVAAFATTADEGEIGSRLGDLGFRDSGGVLARGEAEPAIRLEEGIVFASDEPDALRSIPDEQRDDPPAQLLEELDGDDIAVNRIDDQCYSESGASVAVDGSVELAVLVPGGGEAERFTPDTGEVGEADADGEVVTKPVIDRAEGEAARSLLAEFWPGYDCGG